MDFVYDADYFKTSEPSILDNDKLREPQRVAYCKVYEHFIEKEKDTHALIVLPTGVGKTGVMGILPYGISNGRVLIITPQLTIKDTVIDSLNPDHPKNFWMSRGVFKNPSELPTVIEFEGSKTTTQILQLANIVILNVQKLQGRLESSPINTLPKDFFDMIIIDEAHHSTANTWVETVKYFSEAKVIKLTGTPLRSDKKEIAGELVYRYKLSQAMANNYVKSLVNVVYVPDKLYLTIDGDSGKRYTVEQLIEMNIKDEDYISRSVAYSIECSKVIVEKSLELLEAKLGGGNTVPHKIIAIACSIEHAEQIQKLYEEKHYTSVVIHSKLSSEEIEKRKNDIKNNRVQVVINVAMLGEGYDHCYLSIAAIFRPFRSALPYAQFVGRILRRIPEEECSKAIDNIGEIVSHKHLGLERLWNEYKVEIQESEIIKHLKEDNELQEINKGDGNNKVISVEFGKVDEQGSGNIETQDYLETELLKRHKIEQEKNERKIREVQKLLNLDREMAIKVINTSVGASNEIKRPDIYYAQKKKDIDTRIKEEIVPMLITKYNINQKARDLDKCSIFRGKYGWIPTRAKDNGAMLAIYLNTYLKNEVGVGKSEWKLEDCEIAVKRLDEMVEYYMVF